MPTHTDTWGHTIVFISIKIFIFHSQFLFYKQKNPSYSQSVQQIFADILCKFGTKEYFVSYSSVSLYSWLSLFQYMYVVRTTVSIYRATMIFMNIPHKSALYIGILNIKTDKTPFVVQMHQFLYKRLQELCRNEKLCINFPL